MRTKHFLAHLKSLYMIFWHERNAFHWNDARPFPPTHTVSLDGNVIETQWPFVLRLAPQSNVQTHLWQTYERISYLPLLQWFSSENATISFLTGWLINIGCHQKKIEPILHLSKASNQMEKGGNGREMTKDDNGGHVKGHPEVILTQIGVKKSKKKSKRLNDSSQASQSQRIRTGLPFDIKLEQVLKINNILMKLSLSCLVSKRRVSNRKSSYLTKF